MDQETWPSKLPPGDGTATYVVHRPVKTFPVVYRAWFAGGGYRSCESFQEAMSAISPKRGGVVRVDKIEQAILWSAEPLKEEGPR